MGKMFLKAQDDVLKCLVLSTTQRNHKIFTFRKLFYTQTGYSTIEILYLQPIYESLQPCNM